MAKGEFSVVVALYDVERYVDAFLKSLLNQSYPFEDLDIIVINDGTRDASMEVVEHWRAKYPNVIRVINKKNGGPASARNVGLDAVRNAWVTFPDPDDTLHPQYFSQIVKFLSKNTDIPIQMLTSRLVQHEDGTVSTKHSHPLDWKFRQGDKIVDLDSNPNFVQLSGGTVFLRTELIQKYRLKFDERIRPKFEDANLIGRYLASTQKPIVGVVASARYFYRKRFDGSSLVQSAWSNPGVYDEVPRFGYLGLLESVTKIKGFVPRWAQFMVIYELVWAYVEQKRMHSRTGEATESERSLFLANFDRIMSHIDAAAVNEFSAVGQGWIFHNILSKHAAKVSAWISPVIEWDTDQQREIIKYSYIYAGVLPDEVFSLGGIEVRPVSIKSVRHELFGRPEVYERVFTLPYGEVALRLNGREFLVQKRANIPKRSGTVPLGSSLRLSDETSPNQTLVQLDCAQGPTQPGKLRAVMLSIPRIRRVEEKLEVQSILMNSSKERTAIAAANRMRGRAIGTVLNVADRRSRKRANSLANSGEVAMKFKNAWVLMDRKDRADDNAEHLYRYLAKNRQDLNLWFVLESTSSDWSRLEAEGFRLLSHGSAEAACAYRYAAYNISSHADRDVQYPMDSKIYGKSSAKIVFLQHGIIKDDLSLWLNNKPTSLMLATTHDEFSSIVDDDTSYRWTSNEVALTGLPRHDELRKLVLSSAGQRRHNILFAPTWRQYITNLFLDGNDTDEMVRLFESSDFGRNWLGLLRDERLQAIAKNMNVRIRFLAHPNLAPILPYINLPEYVDILSYHEISVQKELVESAIVVSDFSSLAFEAVLAEANIIYFQFDGDDIYKGGHVYRKGYFDYQMHGFGPRVETAEETIDILVNMVKSSLAPEELYKERIEAAFRFRDQRNCERATTAIENLDRPWFDQKPLVFIPDENPFFEYSRGGDILSNVEVL